jgi:hypothetical protein
VNLGTAVTVSYATAPGSAAAGADFTSTTGLLKFAAGQAAATIRIPIVNDVFREQAETFTVTLSAPSANARLGLSTTKVTINDDDPAPPRVVAVRGVGRHSAVEQVVVDFSGPMDPISAANVASYTVRRAGKDKLFGTKDDVILGVSRAIYDATAHRTTLTLAHPFGRRDVLQLVARGSRIRGSGSQALDGNNDGYAGGDFVGVVRT